MQKRKTKEGKKMSINRKYKKRRNTFKIPINKINANRLK